MINKLVANIKKNRSTYRCRTWIRCFPMYQSRYRKKAFAEYGETLEGAAEAIWQFNKEIVDKTYDLIPAVKTADRHV